jgi:predicted RNase H-like HicB family nuclease
MKAYTTILERTSTGFGGYSPDVPGCVSAGSTVEETLELLRRALVLHLGDLFSTGQPIPEARGIEFYLQSEMDRPGPTDLIGFVPVREVAPGLVA